MLNGYDKDSKALKKLILRQCWAMRGSITIDDAWQMSFADRELINSLINENVEITNETQLPYF
jgi:hypothetical protein